MLPTSCLTWQPEHTLSPWQLPWPHAGHAERHELLVKPRFYAQAQAPSVRYARSMRIRGLHKRHTVAKSGSDAFIFEVEGPPDKPDANEHTMITRYNELLRDSELIQELR